MKTCVYCEKYCEHWQEDGCHYALECDFKAKVKVADSRSGRNYGQQGSKRQRHCRLSGSKDLKGFGSTLPLGHAETRERELDYTQV